MKSYLAFSSLAIVLAAATSAPATVFFTDDFSYADGNLIDVSNGLWFAHSGQEDRQIQVVNEQAIVKQPGGEDVNRFSGSILSPGDTWYYALQFSVEDMRDTPGVGSFATAYFAHFKDGGTFNFRGRLYVTPGSDPANYTLGLTSSSATVPEVLPWGNDLNFGTTYTAVVSYTASQNDPANGDPLTGMDGWSSLWVNPVDASSTNIVFSTPPDNVGSDVLAGMNSLALRQHNSGSTDIHVDIVAMGDSFDDVLAAVGGSPPVADGDFDGDGTVDGHDFLMWQRGETPESGSPAELAAWEANFGTTPPAAVAAIPEPGSLALLLLAAVSLTLRRP